MPDLHVIANDIRSRENVGGLFRTYDFLGVSKLWLTGYTSAPPDPRLEKVALGAHKTVTWEAVTDVRSAIERLKQDGYRIVGLELDEGATLLSAYDAPERVALLLGNEVTGIPPSLLNLCDDIVMISRHGQKESLNVAIAAGIAMWSILN
ncbi:MAG: TrmH family RNA methyltransferase [Patescibacteria group bacterium]|jgi:tRNA G18 (ribose-2'-O)-methylase SpoU